MRRRADREFGGGVSVPRQACASTRRIAHRARRLGGVCATPVTLSRSRALPGPLLRGDERSLRSSRVPDQGNAETCELAREWPIAELRKLGEPSAVRLAPPASRAAH